MGQHYAQTLPLWDEAFLAASEQVLELGFDETFLRMWHFYLEYSRAGFASGYIDVNQLTFDRAAPRDHHARPRLHAPAGTSTTAGAGVAQRLAEALAPVHRRR